MDKIVLELLKNKPTDEKLYTLGDISTVRGWNYELPTLTFAGRFTSRQNWNTSKEFRDVFCSLYPLFGHADLSGLAIVGGAIFDILHDRTHSVKDIDIFMVGDEFDLAKHSPEIVEQNVIKRAEKFIQDIYKFLEYHTEETNKKYEKQHLAQDTQMLTKLINQFHATRNGPVISLSVPLISVPIQLVLAPNASLSKLFQRVDLDCTAMAYYQNEVYFSSIGKFCFENACVFVGAYSNPNFEERLQKYYQKGMDIILPFLDIQRIPKRNLEFHVSEVIDLPTLAIVYDQINGNKILIDRLIPRKNTTPIKDSSETTQGTLIGTGGINAAAAYGGGSSTMKNSGQIIHENIIHLIHDLPQKFQYYGEGKHIHDVLLSIPNLTNRMITNSFETISERLISGLEGQAVDFKLFENYFTCKSLIQIINDLYVLPLQIKEKETYHGNLEESMKYTLFDTSYQIAKKEYIDALVQEQIQLTNTMLTKILEDAKQNPNKYPVVTMNNALTNEPLDPKHWFSIYYKA